MKMRYRLIRRNCRKGTFYCQDTQTGKRTSLRTKSEAEALEIVQAKNQSLRQPVLNLQIAKAYLAGSDSGINTRTWQDALDMIVETKQGPTKDRWMRASRERALDLIRNLVIIETHAEHLMRVLKLGTISTNVHLRKLHNFCLDMNWLPWPIIPKKQWPPIRFKEKRAITTEEHKRIVEAESNDEMRAFYELCWHLGGSQSDVAMLTADSVQWQERIVSYHRQKTQSLSTLHFGEELAAILRSLPRSGYLLPRIARMHEKHRAKEFKRRCLGLGIKGITLHSDRYSWAERAKKCGYPERFAQEALGHNSKAVHRAYARNAQVHVPSLEAYEKAYVKSNVIPFNLQQGQMAEAALISTSKEASNE
jgi:integrase